MLSVSRSSRKTVNSKMYREFDNNYFHSCDLNELKQIGCYFYSNFYMSFILLICVYITVGISFGK